MQGPEESNGCMQFHTWKCSSLLKTKVVAEKHIAHLVKSVGEASHELGLDKLGLATLELALLLHCERCGLQAELGHAVVASLEVLQVRRAALQHGAGVGNATALDLQVRQALQLIVGQGLGTLREALDRQITIEMDHHIPALGTAM